MIQCRRCRARSGRVPGGPVSELVLKPIDMSLVAVAEADYVTVPLEKEDEAEELTIEIS
jgi:hypothetical protein